MNGEVERRVREKYIGDVCCMDDRSVDVGKIMFDDCCFLEEHSKHLDVCSK